MPEPRWHEIATEGLPEPGLWVLVWAGTPSHFEIARMEPHSVLGAWLDQDHRKVHDVTHWQMLPLLPPPTKEPR